MRNKFKGFIAATSLAALSAIPLQAAQAEYNLTLCGASPGGLWSLLGAGVDAAVKESFPGSTVTYQTSGGGFANVVQLDQSKCDLAIIHDAEVKAARAGEAPFSAPVDSMRSVAVMYTWAPLQLLMNKDFADENGISTMEDIAAKKIPIHLLLNKKGNVVSDVGASMLTAVGASPEMIEKWGGSVTYAASKEQGELMRDRRADAILNSLFVNHGSIRELASAIDLRLIPVTQSTADAVAKEWNINAFTIPGGSYPWAPDDTLTVSVSAQLFVRQDADPAMVKDVTTALLDHSDKISGVHKAMAALDTKLMATASAAPYHDAAEAVYVAKGLR